MVNNVKRCVALAAIHDAIVPVSQAEDLFGEGTVRKSVALGLVSEKGGYLGWGSRKDADRKRIFSKQKMEKAQKWLTVLERIPWVRFVAVTGSVCHGSASEDDDIDVFIVAGHNRLWLTRVAEQVILRLKGVRRRYGDEDVSDKFCINFYTSDSRLDLSRSGKKDFMTALEIAVMKPVVNPGFYPLILQENRWVQKYFPAIDIVEREETHSRRGTFLSAPGDLLDWICMKLSLTYMRILGHPVQSVLVERNRIEFFDKNSWDEKEDEWRKRLELDDVS